VLIGTALRTSALGQPVTGTIVSGNTATIAGNANPYRWVHGHINTTVSNNLSQGRPAGMCEGLAPARGRFVMTLAFVFATEPPPDPPPPLALPGPLGSCPLACSAAVMVPSPSIRITRVDPWGPTPACAMGGRSPAGRAEDHHRGTQRRTESSAVKIAWVEAVPPMGDNGYLHG
jgi:hypothetical protein